MSNNTTIPAPLAWTPSSYWDGSDGTWNSFIIQVGTPPQSFRIFPATAGQETWVPIPDGCTSADPTDPGYCGFLRGTLPVNGQNSSGFETNQSSTWVSEGLFELTAQEAQLGYGGDGDYGFDTVVWGSGMNLTQQVVAGISTSDYWLGVAGLGPKSINFTNYNAPVPSFLSTLVNQSLIPSLSWGYTAGAAYRNRSAASLTLGGYDTNRFKGTGLSVGMNGDDSRPLQIGVQKILATNTLNGDVNLLPTATYHFIDSTIPHIWVPDDSIAAFVSAFGLIYDNQTDLFRINDTMHERLLNLNPTITFVLAESTVANSGTTQNIILPYAAFDLQAVYPFYQNATNYFPIRRAANDTQYTIGRTFLQEAYVVADFGRQNFTVAQTSFTDLDTQHLVAVEKPAQATSPSSVSSTSSNSNASGGISGGAIAGIVVGAVCVIALLGLAAWFFLRRRKQKRTKETELAEFSDEKKAPLVGDGGAELPADSHVNEVPGAAHQLHEADSHAMRSEVGGDTAKWGPGGVQELSAPAVGHETGLLAEVPGSEAKVSEAPDNEVVRYELPGSEVKPSFEHK